MLNHHHISHWLPQKVAHMEPETIAFLQQMSPRIENIPAPTGSPEYWSLYHNLSRIPKLPPQLVTTVAIVGTLYNDKTFGDQIPAKMKELLELHKVPSTKRELQFEILSTMSTLMEKNPLLGPTVDEHTLGELLWFLSGQPYNPPYDLQPVVGIHLCYHRGQPESVCQTAHGWSITRENITFDINDSYFAIPQHVRIAEIDTLLTELLKNPRRHLG